MIDYKSYLEMDSKDLKKLMEHAENILNVRQQEECDAMMNLDKVALLKTFEQNESRELSDKAWQAFNIYKVTFDTLDFFELIRTLPQYEEKNKQKNPESYEQILIGKAFENVDYLNYFLERQEYLPIIIKDLQTGKPLKYMSENKSQVVDTLIDRGLLKKPDNEILTQISLWGQPKLFMGYLEYALTHHNVTLPQAQAQELFKRNWNHCSSGLLEILWDGYCHGASFKMDMDDAVKSCSTLAYYEESKSYDNFVQLPTEYFTFALGRFDVTPEMVEKMIKSLRTVINNDYQLKGSIEESIKNNLIEIFKYVNHHLPQAREIMEKYVQDEKYPEFKKLATPMMRYLQFNQDIPMNNLQDSQSLGTQGGLKI
jgi:hypothetical protein